jgi:hypothetical protein
MSIITHIQFAQERYNHISENRQQADQSYCKPHRDDTLLTARLNVRKEEYKNYKL